MSGICGVVVGHTVLAGPRRRQVDGEGLDPAGVERLLGAAARTQAHRGPDGRGQSVVLVDDWNVGLGHQRLAVIDLSARARQPLTGPGGEGLLVLDGELYNYRELRRRLGAEGVVFTTFSDAEVVAAALSSWGVERALRSFNGMWAFAWLDRERRRLVLARDRLGLKPLYLHLRPTRLDFASEIKTLLAMDDRRFRLDLGSVRTYLEEGRLDTSSATMFEGIERLEAGSFLEVDLGARRLEPRPHRYWAPPHENGRATVGANQLRDDVRALIHDAVRLRLRSDAPVGVLLSGGLDSSAIAGAIGAMTGGREVSLISASIAGTRHDESSYVDSVARSLGRPVRRVQIDVAPSAVLGLLETVTWHNDEPVAGFDSVAQYQLMQAAKEQGVTVMLSGRGADEPLAGHPSYLGHHLREQVRSGHPAAALDTLVGAARLGEPLRSMSREAHRYLGPRRRARAILGPTFAGMADEPPAPTGLTLQQRQVLDLTRLTVPAMAHTEDRMAMAHGRALRLPFLDYRLVERLLPLGGDAKLRHGWTKYLLRHALERDLPPEVAWRRDRRAFDLPHGGWLRFELRARLLELFTPDALVFRYGLLDRNAFLAAYRRYTRLGELGSGVPSRSVFGPLALELWLRRFSPHLEAPA